MEKRLIPHTRSVIPACDVDSLGKLELIVRATCAISGIGAYKIGLELLRYGLDAVVVQIRRYTDLPIIYDHQKGGTDIPDLGPKFARMARSAGVAGVDAVILFPFGGAMTEREWIKACQGEGLTVLVGGHMTQKEFLSSEGGFIFDEAPIKIYTIAAELGVRNFVVPGNKPEYVVKYRNLLERLLGVGNFTLYAPGFIKQGGDISDAGKAAGDNWHAIVGSAFTEKQTKEEILQVANILTSQIMAVNK